MESSEMFDPSVNLGPPCPLDSSNDSEAPRPEMLVKDPRKRTLSPGTMKLPSPRPKKNIGSIAGRSTGVKNHDQGSKWLSREKGQGSLLVQSDPTAKMSRFMRAGKTNTS